MSGNVTTFRIRMANHISVQYLLALNDLVRVASFQSSSVGKLHCHMLQTSL